MNNVQNRRGQKELPRGRYGPLAPPAYNIGSLQFPNALDYLRNRRIQERTNLGKSKLFKVHFCIRITIFWLSVFSELAASPVLLEVTLR